MKFTDLKFEPHPNYKTSGVQAKYFFSNDYGVSVVRSPGSYGFTEGLYEVAVLKGTENNWKICYDTPVTYDVLGHRDEQDIENIMKEVSSL
jgi:hypothetical protein